MQVCFALMCVSFIACNPHQGGDLICAVRAANSGVQGGAWNLATWNLPTCVGKKSTQAVGRLPTLLGPELPTREPVKKSKIPADREQPTLLVPSAVRSPGNLRRKRSTFSLMSEQFSHRPGNGCFATRGRKFWENHGLRSLGPLQGISGPGQMGSF